MGEKPKEEILKTPQYAILEFGDGYIALMQGGIQKEDEDGKKIVVLIIKPHSTLRKRYDIKESDLDANGNMEITMNRNDLVELNPLDDVNRKWMYLKTFDHQETEISERVEKNLRERNDFLRERNHALQAQLMWYSEQLQLAKSNPQEFLTQGNEVFNKMIDSFGYLWDKQRQQPRQEGQQ